MKRYMHFPKSILRQIFWLLVFTGPLICILKCIKIEKIFSRTKSYFMEPYIISIFMKNEELISVDTSNDINCSSIFEMDPSEIRRSLEIQKMHIVDLEDENITAMTCDCNAYKNLRQYHMKPLSFEEKNFPIAYSIVVHKDAINVERLLCTIYNPWNVYCIHYDKKSSTIFKMAMINLAKCFSNVFIASKIERVIYTHISRLRADLNCLSDLLNFSVQWNYVINLCGQDMPLMSNYKLVTELKKLNGRNMLETSRPNDKKKQRFRYHYEVRKKQDSDCTEMLVRTFFIKDPPPSNIEIFVGSSYFVLSRLFIDYIFHCPLVSDFLFWSKDTFSPDEHFWATLARFPGIPGEIKNTDYDVTDLQSRTRLVKWRMHNTYPNCTGIYVRSVCIYGAAELRWLVTSGYWFGNKVDPKVDPILVKCLIENIEEQQRQNVQLSLS
ncbi:beta-1,3-galactosyl-O-glycosyl-glycoprotein beta-1,6-N-acetylglucosaminyltransferase 4-like [Bombina bombina]|uniref:beta-1,3-galactosyl-O-glycosyl-glycoprotein beta-1,6-N-acetylglucosaminyltransferase 4-like n=1 Tax=Bombina bombina TaxID=8345 RepID=UPI00235AC2E4|nr:beta-1,3-galactosyl-O-glycosyl-glycoprotein beta-1,6-N-acetylglucosaminyltransferase 4-like [Bombina bombina]